MSYNIRKISNGILIGGPVGKDGEYQEKAFLTSDTKWEEEAKAYMDTHKDKIADSIITQATNQMSNLKDQMKKSKTK